MTPARAIRPKTVAEKEFCALGPVAEAFIAGAAAAGHTRLGQELAELNTLAEAAAGSRAERTDPVVPSLAEAVASVPGCSLTQAAPAWTVPALVDTWISCPSIGRQ